MANCPAPREPAIRSDYRWCGEHWVLSVLHARKLPIKFSARMHWGQYLSVPLMLRLINFSHTDPRKASLSVLNRLDERFAGNFEQYRFVSKVFEQHRIEIADLLI
jgi:hypothetical protein